MRLVVPMHAGNRHAEDESSADAAPRRPRPALARGARSSSSTASSSRGRPGSAARRLRTGPPRLWPDPERFSRAVALFAGAGFQCVTHAIGDRAARFTLDATRAGAAPGIRHRIEHIETLTDEDLPRFAVEGVVASMQAIHLENMHADRGATRGAGRSAPSAATVPSACGDLIDSGARLALGSDWPVARYDPWRGHGLGSPPPPRPRCPRRGGALQRQPGADGARGALEGYTTGAGPTPSATRAEAGRIAVGFRADLTAVPADPVECPADDLPDLPVLLTVVAGARTNPQP